MAILHFPPAEFRAKTDAVAATIGGIEGRARSIGVRTPDGQSYELIAISADKGCLHVSAVVGATHGAEIPLDRISSFSSAIGIEGYGPTPAPERPKPCDPEQLSLLELLRNGGCR
jgi:hypothetical protein